MKPRTLTKGDAVSAHLPALHLYQHEDGRYGVSIGGPAKFAKGKPEWHRVPIDVLDVMLTDAAVIHNTGRAA
jgi:hypothetical protein